MTLRLVGLMSVVLLLSLAAFGLLMNHYQDQVMQEVAHTASEVGRAAFRTLHTDAESRFGVRFPEDANVFAWSTNYRFEGPHEAAPAGDEMVFELISDEFDPVLYLDGPGLNAPLMDDDGAGSLDSRIVFTATESGVMRLVVTALGSDGAGTFRLRAIRRAR